MEEGSSAQDVDERQWVTEQDTAAPKGRHTQAHHQVQPQWARTQATCSQTWTTATDDTKGQNERTGAGATYGPCVGSGSAGARLSGLAKGT